MYRGLVQLAVLGMLAAGCDAGPGPAPPDGDPLPGGEVVEIPWLDEGAPPLAPPALPPCPEGWREVPAEAGDPALCDPWPEAGRADCASPGETHFPGATGCELVGAACPADGWPAVLPADRAAVYVRADAAAGGDGSLDRPFATLAAAAAAAPDGAVIALATGTYEGPLRVEGRDLVVQGACPAGTTVTAASASDTEGALHAGAGARLEVVDLRVGDCPRPGLAASDGGRLEARGVVVERARHRSVYVEDAGSVLTLDRALVHETQGLPGSVPWGVGLMAALGGRLEARTLVTEGNLGGGILAAGEGAVLVVDGASIRGTRPLLADGSGGGGLWVELGGTAEVHAAVFERDTDTGVVAMDLGSAARLDQVVVRDSGWTDGEAGHGLCLLARDGARVEVRRGLVEGCHGYGAVAREAGSTLVLEDSVLRDTRSGTDGEGGGGVAGLGLLAAEGGRIEARRARVLRSRFAGVATAVTSTYPAEAPGSSALLEDVAIEESLPQERDGDVGVGLLVRPRTTVEAHRLVVRRATAAGVYVMSGEARLEAEDLLVVDTLGDPATGMGGRGLEVTGGASATLLRAAVVRAREVAVAVFHEGSSLRADDLVVVDTEPRLCAETTCVGFGGGIGIGAYEGARLEAHRFYVSGSPLCGVQLAWDGEMDLTEGIVTGNLVGANVQSEGFDVGRISGSVAYSDNDRNLDAAALPVPDASPPPDI